MIQNHEHNYLTEDNGCQVIKCSSQNNKGPASNLLKPINKLIWFTSDPLPHQIVISLKNSIDQPQIYNNIGFYCWHQYDTNPALIQVFVKRYDSNQMWKLISKIRLQMNDGWQNFKINEINANALKEIKIKIVQNFGGEKVYLNQIALRYAKPYPSVTRQSKALQQYQNLLIQKKQGYQSKREKTFSQFTKLTSTQKQLKKAKQKIRQLAQQQNGMQHRMEKQDKIIQKHEKTIIKLQESMKMMLSTIEKLHKMQQIKQTGYDTHELPYKSGKQSVSKKKFEKEKPQKKSYSIHKEGEFIRMDSDNEFSEYTNSNMNTIQSINKNSVNKQLLLQLLTLRKEKKKRLRSQQNSHINQPYESYDDDDSDYQ